MRANKLIRGGSVLLLLVFLAFFAFLQFSSNSHTLFPTILY